MSEVPTEKVYRVDGSNEAAQGILHNTELSLGLRGCSGLGLFSGKEPLQHWRQNSSQNTQKTLELGQKENIPPRKF